MAVENTVVYYDTATIMAVKSFRVQASGLWFRNISIVPTALVAIFHMDLQNLDSLD
jgi:hypothetical protein